jgi:hypothetical protein
MVIESTAEQGTDQWVERGLPKKFFRKFLDKAGTPVADRNGALRMNFRMVTSHPDSLTQTTYSIQARPDRPISWFWPASGTS